MPLLHTFVVPYCGVLDGILSFAIHVRVAQRGDEGASGQRLGTLTIALSLSLSASLALSFSFSFSHQPWHG